MDVAKVILPASDRYFVFQPARRLSNISHIWLNVSRVTRLVNVGIPRYVHNSSVAAILRASQILVCCVSCMFSEKYTLDFAKLNFCPDAWKNRCRTSFITVSCSTSASANKITSLAKNKLDKSGLSRLARIGFHF